MRLTGQVSSVGFFIGKSYFKYPLKVLDSYAASLGLQSGINEPPIPVSLSLIFFLFLLFSVKKVLSADLQTQSYMSAPCDKLVLRSTLTKEQREAERELGA